MTHGEEPNELVLLMSFKKLHFYGTEDSYLVPLFELLIVHRCALWSGRGFNEQSKETESQMFLLVFPCYRDSQTSQEEDGW